MLMLFTTLGISQSNSKQISSLKKSNLKHSELASPKCLTNAANSATVQRKLGQTISQKGVALPIPTLNANIANRQISESEIVKNFSNYELVISNLKVNNPQLYESFLRDRIILLRLVHARESLTQKQESQLSDLVEKYMLTLK